MNFHDRRELHALLRRRTAPSQEPAQGKTSPAGPLGNRGLARLLDSPALEAQAERAAAATGTARNPGRSGAAAATPAGSRSGQPLAAAIRHHFEAGFGQDFGNVRVHDDAGVQAPLRAAGATAFTEGDDIAFAPGAYRPDTRAGRHLLAHELAHVVQQRGGAPAVAGGAPALGAAPRGRQAKSDRAALLARLQAVRLRLAELRAQQDRNSDRFAAATMQQRLGESLAKGTRDLHAQARADMAAGQLWGGPRAGQAIKRAVGVAQSGNAVTLTANFQISYDGVGEKEGRKRAAVDIPRIEAAIRDVWRVDITAGDYAGIQFRLVAKVAYLAPKKTRAGDAFLIAVRKPDKQPSSADSVHGLISLAPVHLEGARVIVVAHELAHLFGFVDAYLKMILHEKPGKPRKDTEKWAVGRTDPQNRADLLGLIDPVVLKRLHDQGAVGDSEFARQTRPVQVWEQEASVVLKTLGVAPLPPAPASFDDEDFDPAVELGRLRDEGEKTLADIEARRGRIDDTMAWLQAAEETIALEQEEKDLVQKLATVPAPP